VATDEHQEFYSYWLKSSSSTKFLDTFPYELSFGPIPKTTEALLPFHPSRMLGNQILVTESYNRILHRLLRLRSRDMDMGDTCGALLTGQPGTGASMSRSPLRAKTHRCIRSLGKSTFLKFMLMSLISAHQVVLLCDNQWIHLFYHGQAYFRSTEDGFEDIPKLREDTYFPLWALIDLDFGESLPPLNRHTNVWPIQVSSPNPIRWKAWHKQYRAALLGMPLWNMKELRRGYVSLFPFCHQSRPCRSMEVRR